MHSQQEMQKPTLRFVVLRRVQYSLIRLSIILLIWAIIVKYLVQCHTLAPSPRKIASSKIKLCEAFSAFAQTSLQQQKARKCAMLLSRAPTPCLLSNNSFATRKMPFANVCTQTHPLQENEKTSTSLVPSLCDFEHILSQNMFARTSRKTVARHVGK